MNPRRRVIVDQGDLWRRVHRQAVGRAILKAGLLTNAKGVDISTT